MMQSTDLWERDNLACGGSVYGPGLEGVPRRDAAPVEDAVPQQAGFLLAVSAR